MAEIEAEGGKDPTNAIIEQLEEEKKELVEDVMDLWFQKSTEWLTDAAQNRSQLGQQKGRQGRAQTGLHEISQKAVPPQWDASEEAWVFSFPHEGAVFQEFGAQPHEIRARQAEVLAFEWPDAPEEVKEEFSHTEGDLVFFQSVQHPGLPAVGFVRYGRDKAQAVLEQKGYTVEEFIE